MAATRRHFKTNPPASGSGRERAKASVIAGLASAPQEPLAASPSVGAERDPPRPHPARGTEDIQAWLAPIVAAAGFDLIELKCSTSPRGTKIMVFADRPTGQGAISIEDCAVISRKVVAVLEASEPIRGDWELEVSSPGPKRLLRHGADAVRFLGVRARVSVAPAPGAPPHTWVGDLEAADADGLTLRGARREEVRVAWTEVVRAQLDPTPPQWLALGRRLAAGEPADSSKDPEHGKAAVAARAGDADASPSSPRARESARAGTALPSQEAQEKAG